MLKSYLVYDDCEYSEESHCQVVWAANKDEARKAYLKGYEDPSAVYDGSIKVIVRDVDLGAVQPVRTDAHIEGRKSVEREAGMQYEGDSCCSSCGLYECDGECPVCPECDQCETCGCMDDCTENEFPEQS